MIRIGTALAFLVKTCLIAATCIAYSQRMWYSLDDFFAFRHLPLWARLPLPALIGLVAWALALITVFTPGTLTVVPSFESVSQLSYNVTKYAQTSLTSGNYAFLKDRYRLLP